MLTAAVLSGNSESCSALQVNLQQTGLVHTVRGWTGPLLSHPGQGEGIPDLVLLDIDADPAGFFAAAANLRRLKPTVLIIAYSPIQHPDSNLLLQAMRSGVQEFVPKPVDPGTLREMLLRFIREQEVAVARAQQKLIVFMGSKGGVGTSTIAVNLGAQLAKAGRKKVVLLDLARPVGHIALLLDLKPRFSIRDAVENVERLDANFFGGLLVRHSTGLEVMAGTSHPEEWEKIPGGDLVRVANVAQSTSDFVLVDGGVYGSGDSAALLQTARAVVLVAETSVPALWAIERRFAAIVSMGIDPARIRIFINRWRRTDDEALAKLEKNMKHPIFARIPNDFQHVSHAVNSGAPVAENHNNTLVTKYRQIALQLAGIDPNSMEKRTGLSGLFSSKR
jgi:pilus assembly protein CpaE